MKSKSHYRRSQKLRACVLSEANALLSIAKNILDEAGIENSLRDQIQTFTDEELKCLQISDGKIESRKRFKSKTGNHILEDRIKNTLYIDESGKSYKSNQGYFALGAIAMSEDQKKIYLERANAIKSRFFNTTNITFHEPYMRNREGVFKCSSLEEYNSFISEIDDLLNQLDFTVFGAGIRISKIEKYFEFSQEQNFLPVDIYHCAIVLLLERYLDFLGASDNNLIGNLVFESQGPKEDIIHQHAYALTLKEGSQWISEKAFRDLLKPGLTFVPKQGSHPTEISDMFSRDLFEWLRSGCECNPLRWDIFTKKIYKRGDGKNGKFGLKVFPDHDIREQIEKHRASSVVGIKSAFSQGD